MLRGADFTSQDFYRDPSGVIARLQAEGPLVRAKLPIIGTVWLATTMEMAARILKDDETFTIRKEGGGIAGLQWWMPGVIKALAENMLTKDEPDHGRLRRIVDEAFRRRAVLDMEPRIRALADGLADELFTEERPADLVTRYARRLPLLVICELLGLPSEDRVPFMRWSDRATDVTGLVSFVRMVPALSAIRRYLARFIDDVRAHGGDGLIAELVRAEREGAEISDEEMVAMVFLLLFAGHETTTHLISGAVFELLKDRDLRDWLLEDPARGSLGVEEFLRYGSPVQFTKPRHARRDIELGGVTIAKNDKVMAMLAAANMDPAANEAPRRLDLARAPNRHIAFGTGIHFCLGHQLARLEARCALEALFTRWPALRLAVDEEAVRWRARAGLRAIETLPVAETG